LPLIKWLGWSTHDQPSKKKQGILFQAHFYDETNKNLYLFEIRRVIPAHSKHHPFDLQEIESYFVVCVYIYMLILASQPGNTPDIRDVKAI